MTKCKYCQDETDLPFICSYCKSPFCVNHRLPESHACPNLFEAKRPPITIKNKTIFGENREGSRRFSLLSSRRTDFSEVKQLAIAWLVLSFCFSVGALFNLYQFLQVFLISLSTLGVGFLFHELAHRNVARRFGCWAEFRLWPMGLLLALIFALISGGRMIFAAPGAVYIVPRSYSFGYGIGKRENGLISLVGPLMNITVAFFFLGLSLLGGIFSPIGSIGFKVNIWLAAFNLIPFGMMDGRKVLSWSPIIWGCVTIPTWILVFIPSII